MTKLYESSSHNVNFKKKIMKIITALHHASNAEFTLNLTNPIYRLRANVCPCLCTRCFLSDTLCVLCQFTWVLLVAELQRMENNASAKLFLPIFAYCSAKSTL